MNKKKWLALFGILVVLALALWAGCNFLIDPFGVFGDPIFHWNRYNETNNPYTAKVSWLESHQDMYDSYLIGSSAASALDTDTLERYLGGQFYDLTISRCDAKDYRDLAAYVLEHCQAKRLVLALGLEEANGFGLEKSGTRALAHPLASGGSAPMFYLRYAFANPRHAVRKLSAWNQRDLWDQLFDINEKWTLDVEKVGALDEYDAERSGSFTLPPDEDQLPYIDACVQAIAEIRDLCAEKDTELLVICPPVHTAQWDLYSEETLRSYKTALAQAVDYWDFSCTALSSDDRYFYDAVHCRSAVGEMMLAEICGDGSVWYPEHFGAYVTKETCGVFLDNLFTAPVQEEDEVTEIQVPILMYHHISQEPASDMEISPEVFAEHMDALSQAGYTAVLFQDLVDFVYHGGPLPEKPVCITMDDGYLSNYETAWPILEQYGMKGTIFVIGSSIGHTEYKDTQYPITPHFDWDQAREMQDSGVIDIQCHTYDMHQWTPYETGDKIRKSVLRLEGESEEEYYAAVTEDLAYYDELRRQEMGEGFLVLAYPGGDFDEVSEEIIHQQVGFPVTVTSLEGGLNTVVRGIPQSLYALYRWNITDHITGQQLLEKIS